ncbi:MAG: aminotransferase class V-fold PLP-dependent enzyme [Cyanobacteriota bacterium]|nr:aminotransferase class V-fold PLP-dependent enzyme [Cyanobacteriota bacterium]
MTICHPFPQGGIPPMIPCQKALFEIPPDVTYLNCAYMSPLLTAVREAGQQAVARKSSPWQIRPHDFFEEAEQARGLFAQLIGATPDDIALIPAVSYGLAVAAQNLKLKPQGSMLVLAEQFPSHVYPWRRLAERQQAKLFTIPRPPDQDWTAALWERIGDSTTVVAIPHCHWTDGGWIDLVAIGERCRQVGAALVLDVTQSLGALPLDVAAIQPDFLVCATYKWLLGPYSMGFLYVAPPHQQGQPLEEGWIARQGSENFACLVDYQDAYQPGSRRFDVGERSNFALLPMVITALRQILTWQVSEIATTLGSLTHKLAMGVAERGLITAPAHQRANHMLGIRFPDGLPADLMERLAQERVYVSQRGSSIRVSPHLYNDLTDIERLLHLILP